MSDDEILKLAHETGVLGEVMADEYKRDMGIAASDIYFTHNATYEAILKFAQALRQQPAQGKGE